MDNIITAFVRAWERTFFFFNEIIYGKLKKNFFLTKLYMANYKNSWKFLK
jgi:hypothetical protein